MLYLSTPSYVYIFLWHGRGAPSTLTPWQAIPKDVYYFYNQFMLAPSMFSGWILAAGVAHLLSRVSAGKGSFEDTLSVFGFGVTIATLFALLHDLTDSFLVAIGLLDARWYEVQLNSPTIWRAIHLTLYSIALILLYVLLTKSKKQRKWGTHELIFSNCARDRGEPCQRLF